MREILFRGKRIDNGEWVYGSCIRISDKHSYIVGYFEVNGYDEKQDLMTCVGVIHKVKNTTIGQYTGLTDKNGTKIFEGDVVKSNKLFWEEYVVDYLNCAFVLTRSSDGTEWVCENFNNNEVEVIGNTHDKEVAK